MYKLDVFFFLIQSTLTNQSAFSKGSSVSHESVNGKSQKFIDMTRKSVFEKLFNCKSDFGKKIF